jgi:ubiquinone/menaquinone biosynthesis C-methylase UbiE
MSSLAVSVAAGTAPPELRLIELAFAPLVTQALHVVAELGVADLLKEEPVSIRQLAATTGTNEGALYRVMRSLASVGVFEETEPRTFALNEAAEPLRTDAPNSIRNGIVFMGAEWHWRVWGDLGYSVKTGKPAWGKVHGAECLEYFADRPEHYEIFNRAMTEMSVSSAPAVVEAYDFSKIDTLADIAGGHGFLLSQILRANPRLKGILFDVPSVIEGAARLLTREGVVSRVEKVSGDFFRSIPGGADAYLMKHIIHDWDDARAKLILHNISRVIRRGGRVLLVEIVVPEGNDQHLSKLMDLEMLTSPGGVERTAREYRLLLGQSGFRLTQIIPTKSAYSIIEAIKD